MTREEAALILHPDTTISALERWDNSNYETRIALVEEACRMASEVLRHRQPDPDTGLVPCGCGGKAKITEQSLNWLIKCVECGIQLEVYGGRGGAVWSWNRAMGWEDKG